MGGILNFQPATSTAFELHFNTNLELQQSLTVES